MVKEFLLSERFRLELHWKGVGYEQHGICRLKKAYFLGPALSMAAKINPNEFISLDFCEQYFVYAKRIYVAKFSWGEVIYNKDGTVSLLDAVISHNTVLNIVPKINKSDYIVIDTKGHEEEHHHYSLVYKAYLVKEDGTLYNFGK